MKRGQKCTKNGYQIPLFPMETMNITQGNNGKVSHQGVTALDIAGKNTGIEPTFAPVDMVYKWHDVYKNGNAIFFQSAKKVLCADGTVDYITMMFIHDNYINDILALAKNGYVFKQGDEFGDEGTAGYAFGNHCHFEVAKGKYSKPYDQNPTTKVYCLHNSISAEKVCVIDGTAIVNSNGMKWKKAADVKAPSTESKPSSNGTVLNSKPSDFIKETATFYPNTTIKIREAPSTKGKDTGSVYKKGMSVKYDGYVKREGFVWISWIGQSGKRRWMAAGELNSKGQNANPYGTFK